MLTVRPLCLAAIALASSVAAVGADATPAPATQPTRTTTVFAESKKTYAPSIDIEGHDASIAAYEASLADAKTIAERGAKVLGVRLGSPITVETTTWQARSNGSFEPQRTLTFFVGVKVTFELVP